MRSGQFSILRKKTEAPDSRCLELGNGWVLCCHPALPVFNEERKDILLLGYAWQVLPEKGSPEEEIRGLPDEYGEQDILRMEESWCGRYVLICRGVVFTDTCAMLDVFYSKDGISSDCSLLAREAGLPHRLYRPEKGIVMNWMPGPLTHYEGVFKLLPSQLYDLNAEQVRPRKLLASFCPEIPDDEERIQTFIRIFDTSLKNMRKLIPDRKLMIALTGGYDSRSLFALAVHAGIDFDAYTLEYEGIYEDDVLIPRKLCERTGTAHHYIPRDSARFSRELEEQYLDYTSGLILDEDRLFYAHGQYQELTGKYGETAFLRSSIWENVIEYFQRTFSGNGPGFDFYDWFGVREDSVEKRSLEAYFDWERQHPQPPLAASDVFLWEQREGCWLSAIETGFDLLDQAISLQPANCRFFLSLLLQFPREERMVKYHQARIIARACPAIADVPFGSDKRTNESALTVFRDKLKRGFNRLRTLGIRKTCRTYLSMVRKLREKHRLKKRAGRK